MAGFELIMYGRFSGDHLGLPLASLSPANVDTPVAWSTPQGRYIDSPDRVSSCRPDVCTNPYCHSPECISFPLML